MLRSTTDVVPAVASTTLGVLTSTVGATGAGGEGIDVALVDSGVTPVGSLAGRVVNGPDFSDDARVDELRNLDAFGHGTHLAGIVAAVAPDARIVNVKVADSDGTTSLGRLLAGIDWVARHGDDRGLNVRVLNLAFGAESEGSYRDDPIAFAAERAWQQGLVVVASAGNGGAEADGLDSPAHDPYLVAVGALDSGATASLADDGMATFSSRGSASRAPDVVAPGTAILSERVAGSFLDEAFPAARIGERLPRLRHVAGRARRSPVSPRGSWQIARTSILTRSRPCCAIRRAPAARHRHLAPGRGCRRRGRLRGARSAAHVRSSASRSLASAAGCAVASATSSRSRT